MGLRVSSFDTPSRRMAVASSSSAACFSSVRLADPRERASATPWRYRMNARKRARRCGEEEKEKKLTGEAGEEADQARTKLSLVQYIIL